MPDSMELLNTTDLNSEVEYMFKKEKHFILILSPYLDFTDKIQAILSLSSAKIVILYREIYTESKKKKIEEFKTILPNANFYSVRDFHAKAYITSGTMIITSLNLYEHSQINNFELGIVLKDTSYNRMIEKLSEELKFLLKMNGYDTKILDNIELPEVNDLLKDILIRNNKKVDSPNEELLRRFSKQMMDRYTFDRKDCWYKDANVLQRSAKINRNMYEWALENIKL